MDGLYKYKYIYFLFIPRLWYSPEGGHGVTLQDL